MPILHSPFFLAIFFSYPIWGFLLGTIISTRLGGKSIYFRGLGVSMQFISILPIWIAFIIFVQGSEYSAARWTDTFLNYTNLLILLASISGPAVTAYLCRDNDTSCNFITSSLLYSVLAATIWIIFSVVIWLIFGLCGSLSDMIIEVFKAIDLAIRQ